MTSSNLFTISILLNLWLLLDFTDGTVARVSGQATKRGHYLDAISGFIVDNFLHIAVGYYLFVRYNVSNVFFIGGVVSTVLFQYYRLCQYEFKNIYDSIFLKKSKNNKIEFYAKAFKSFELPLMFIVSLVGIEFVLYWFSLYVIFRLVISLTGILLTLRPVNISSTEQ